MTEAPGAIVREIFIEAPPEDVFPYFTDAKKMVVWKAVSAEIDGRPGGDFRIDVTGAGDVARGTFLEIESPAPGRVHLGVGGARWNARAARLDHRGRADA